MPGMADFLVDKSDLSKTRWLETAPPTEADLAPGAVLARIEELALTSNNITYAVFGDAMNYWDFFPSPEPGWGRIPAWGYARIECSRASGVSRGERVYGYFPISTHLVLRPGDVTAGSFIDTAGHRLPLHPVYNTYARVVEEDASATGVENTLRPVLQPLFATGFLIDAHLAEHDWFGAEQVVALSASSKTALGFASALDRRAKHPRLIGLTAKRNRGFVAGTELYDEVVSYDEMECELSRADAVIVDFAGDGAVLTGVHRRVGDRVRASILVGKSHWNTPPPLEELPGASPQLFFAPDHMRRRLEEWGRDGFEARLGEAWREFVARAAQWLEIERHESPQAITDAYLRTLRGEVAPSCALLLRP